MGNCNHVVVSQKLRGFQGRVCRWARCRDEGASCGCAKVPVFFIAHFLSSVSKRQSKSQELTVILGGTYSRRTIPFTSKNTMSMLFVELRTCRTPFWLLVIVGSSTVTIVVLFLNHNRKSNFCHPPSSLILFH
jgi:hypothetical protein